MRLAIQKGLIKDKCMTERAQNVFGVVLFDEHPETELLNAVADGVVRAGWRVQEEAPDIELITEGYYDVELALQHLRLPSTKALISTLGLLDLNKTYSAEVLFDLCDELHKPKMIVSSSPEADMFIEPNAGDLLVSEYDLEVVTNEVVRWLGGLTQQYMNVLEESPIQYERH